MPVATSSAPSTIPRHGPAVPRLVPGDELRGYRVEGVLGAGGMGVVHEATQLSLHRRVALKVLAGDGLGAARLQREALLQACLDHPHVVDVYDVGVCDHGPFIAMQLIRGRTLRQELQAGSLCSDRLFRLLAPVAEALDTAHAAGLVHRDVKPENILIGRRDHAYIADFGIAHARVAPALTGPGEVLGTPGYIAPELLDGAMPQPAADVYAFAAMLLECLRCTEGPALTPELERVLAIGMAAAPTDRHDSVRALVDAADSARRRLQPRGGASRLASTAGRRGHLRRTCVATAGACVLAAFVAAGWLVAGDLDRRPSLALGSPLVTPMSHTDFLAEHRLQAQVSAASGEETGAAVEANLRTADGGAELQATCTVRDLLSGQAMMTIVDVERLLQDGSTATVPCWVRVRLLPGRPYRATLRLWRRADPPILLDTVSRDFVLAGAGR